MQSVKYGAACRGASGEFARQPGLHLVHHRVHCLDLCKPEPIGFERSFQSHQAIEKVLGLIDQPLRFGGEPGNDKRVAAAAFAQRAAAAAQLVLGELARDHGGR